MAKINNSPKIGIIGAGLSGLCAAIQLQQQLDIDDFIVFDENEEVGGTWLVNTYPGCTCDVPSHLYSYSFEPNPNWSKVYAEQHEILEYLKYTARKYDLYPKIQFRRRVISSKWEEKTGKWHVKVSNLETMTNKTYEFDIIVIGVGGLRIPNCPAQFEPFTNPKMHAARWNSSIELNGKVVAIVGSGASAVQIIPEIVDKVERLIVYQRNPPWVMPKIQVAFPNFVKWIFANIPGAQWTYRSLIFWYKDLTHIAFKVNSLFGKMIAKYCDLHLRRQIPGSDPKLSEKLVPKYPIGCKRVTPSNTYYPAMAKPNVTLITSKITSVTTDSIVTKDGTLEKPEVLILATGFHAQEFFAPIKIIGKEGEDVLRKWKSSNPCAYAGITCHKTPNTFFLYGPNTGLGHNSKIFNIECQVNWMIKMIREMSSRSARVMTVTKSAEDEYMSKILTEMESTVWGSHDCGSWYANQNGVVTALYPGSLVSYFNLTKTINFLHFEFSHFNYS